jgi:hypothetical protein
MYEKSAPGHPGRLLPRTKGSYACQKMNRSLFEEILNRRLSRLERIKGFKQPFVINKINWFPYRQLCKFSSNKISVGFISISRKII